VWGDKMLAVYKSQFEGESKKVQKDAFNSALPNVNFAQLHIERVFHLLLRLKCDPANVAKEINWHLKGISLKRLDKKELDIFLSPFMEDVSARPFVVEFKLSVLAKKAKLNQNANKLLEHFNNILCTDCNQQEAIELSKQEILSSKQHFSAQDIEDFTLLLRDSKAMQAQKDFAIKSSAFLCALLNSLPSGSKVELHLYGMNIAPLTVSASHDVINT
jgi:hypothetical protein